MFLGFQYCRDHASRANQHEKKKDEDEGWTKVELQQTETKIKFNSGIFITTLNIYSQIVQMYFSVSPGLTLVKGKVDRKESK